MRRRIIFAMYGDPLKKSRGLIHVGANDGAERHLYAEHGLKVVCIELNPDVFKRLVENIRRLPRLEIDQ